MIARPPSPLALGRAALPSARAFTLVEILISILILALGVLGLGALFPVIIREQRTGSDAVSGVIVSDAARALLTHANWGSGLRPAGQVANPPPGGSPPSGACCTYSSSGVPSCAVQTWTACYASCGVFAGASTSCTAGVCPVSEHPALVRYGPEGANTFLWQALLQPLQFETGGACGATNTYPILRDALGKGWQPNWTGGNIQPYAQGEWFTKTLDPDGTYDGTGTGVAGTVYLGLPPQPGRNFYFGNVKCNGYVELPVAARLYPSTEGLPPQYVWDFAVQRVPTFNPASSPALDSVRAVVFVRRIDPRIRLGQGVSMFDALTSTTIAPADFRVPVGEDANGIPTLDGTDGSGGLRYSGIKTCEVEFWYNPTTPAQNHRDRLYMPTSRVNTNLSLQQLQRLWAQMKQPGQKLVDNLGNIYTVVGSGNETGVPAQDLDTTTGADYIQVDPPVPGYVTKERSAPATQQITYGGTSRTSRAIWQVAFTPQIPVSVTLVELTKGRSQ